MPPRGTDGPEPAPPPVYGLIATGADGAVTFLDPTAAEATGWPADDGIGKPGGQVLRVVAPDGAQDVLATAHRDGAIYQLQRARREQRQDLRWQWTELRDGDPGQYLPRLRSRPVALYRVAL